jgi:CheY-like chemotaxis protein
VPVSSSSYGPFAESAGAGPERIDHGAGETVLIVDDEAAVRMLMTEILTETGYNVLEAANAPSAIKVIDANPHIALLITDVGLPGGMNGRQLAEAVRTRRKDLKVVFITGYAENAAVSTGHLEHGMEILTKPFAMSVLSNKVRQLLET